jgi:hypothetical protein
MRRNAFTLEFMQVSEKRGIILEKVTCSADISNYLVGWLA